MSTYQKTSSTIPADPVHRRTIDRRPRFPLDDLLRSAGFTVVSRPTGEEARWRHPGGDVVDEMVAVGWAKDMLGVSAWRAKMKGGQA